MKMLYLIWALLGFLLSLSSCSHDMHLDSVSPYDPYVLMDLGQMYEKKDVSDSMIWAYEQASLIFGRQFQTSREDSVLSRLLRAQGKLSSIYQKQSAYKLADSVLKQSIELGRTQFGETGYQMAFSYKKLGELRMMEQAFPKADSLLLLATNLYRMGPDSFSVEHAKCLQSQAMSLGNQFRPTEAFPLIRSAVDIMRLHEDKETEAFIFKMYGYTFFQLRNYDSALIYLEKSHKIFEDQYGPRHTYVSNVNEMLGVVYVNIGRLRKADTLLLGVLDFRKSSKDFGPEHPLTSNVYDQLGWNYYQMEAYEKALPYLKEYVRITLRNEGDSARNLHHCYNHLAALYSRMGDPSKAHQYFSKSVRNALIHHNSDALPLFSLYYNYGVFLLIHLQDYALAETYLKRSLAILEANEEVHVLAYVDPYLNLGGAIKGQARFEEALAVQQKAISIALPFREQYPRYLAQSYLHIAETYIRTQKLDSSAYYFRQAERWFSKNGKKSTLSALWNNFAWLLQEQKQFSEAEAYMRLVQTYKQTTVGTNHPQYARVYNRLAEIALAKGDRELAIRRTDSALSILMNIPNSLANIEVPTEKSRSYLINIRSGLLSVAEFDQTYQALLQSIDLIQSSFHHGTSKEQFQRQNVSTYESIIEFLVSRYEQDQDIDWVNKSFTISEKATAFSLRQQLKQLDLSRFSDLNPDVLELEAALQDSIGALNAAYFANRDTVRQAQLEPQIFSCRRRLDSLLHHIHEKYPSYYQAKYSPTVSSLADVQAILPEQSGLLSYFLGGQHSYAWYIDADRIDVQRLAHPDSIRQWIRTYQTHTLSTVEGELSDPLRRISHRLYQELLAPLADLAPRLILVPGGELSSVAFESLLTTDQGRTDIFDQPFLLHRHAITYSYSASIFDLLKQKTDFARQGALIMAPVFRASSRMLPLTPLPLSAEEAAGIHQQIQGKLLLDQQATKATFLRNYANKSIIHLSTHGKMDPSEVRRSSIYFAEDSLTLSDIYGLDMKAQLLVLSACETAKGIYQTGEGIISLAQASMSAGAQSMITSLNIIPDGASKDLMLAFYRELEKGSPKDVALQQAKRLYLQESNPAWTSPRYWAPMILIGDNRPLQVSESWLDFLK
ncbi:MAG: CHAT domain-containing protein [Bacteroidota bacterium]